MEYPRLGGGHGAKPLRPRANHPQPGEIHLQTSKNSVGAFSLGDGVMLFRFFLLFSGSSWREEIGGAWVMVGSSSGGRRFLRIEGGEKRTHTSLTHSRAHEMGGVWGQRIGWSLGPVANIFSSPDSLVLWFFPLTRGTHGLGQWEPHPIPHLWFFKRSFTFSQ